MALGNHFKHHQIPKDVILLAVRWYCRYPLSYRDVRDLMAERGITAAIAYSKQTVAAQCLNVRFGPNLLDYSTIDWTSQPPGAVLFRQRALGILRDSGILPRRPALPASLSTSPGFSWADVGENYDHTNRTSCYESRCQIKITRENKESSSDSPPFHQERRLFGHPLHRPRLATSFSSSGSQSPSI